MANLFTGRTLAVINDLSIEERLYLFEKGRTLKQLLKENNKKELEKFRINDSDFGIYEVFIEDSTRTKESFKNAAEFHRVKLSTLDTDSSSINKNESFADTFNTLCGYDNSIYIVRSKHEGLCRWLEENGKKYAERNELASAPAFINAGDGKHEHPTQELLDDFTFLEHNSWKRDSIHIALVGDLFHGRTVHSKVEGLKIFNKVTVDLIAPPELMMPEHYIERMQENSFKIAVYSSIEEYIGKNRIAPVWYYTRPQLERMGDDILKRQDELRSKIIFKKEFIEKIPEGTVFYHPLPRHKYHPTIPTYLDKTPLNGWEQQSINGKIIRIILLGLTAGIIGEDFIPSEEKKGKAEVKKEFIIPQEIRQKSRIKEYAEGIKPISNGIVIDHICKGENEEEIREQMTRIIKVLGLYGKGGEWISYSRSNEKKMKGIIFRPGEKEPESNKMKQLAALAPGCTLNVIEDRKIIKKLRLEMPPKIYNFPNIGCKNKDCISHESHSEIIPAEFSRTSGDRFICKYCEKPHTFKEIWK